MSDEPTLSDAYDVDDDGRAALEAKREILLEAIEAARPSRRDLASLMTALNDVDEKLASLAEKTKTSILDGFNDMLTGKDRASTQEKMRARIAASEGASSDGNGEPGGGS